MEPRHYELLLMSRHIHDDKLKQFSEKYTSVIEREGRILRYENWGVRNLAYNIDGLPRASYLLMNIYCPPKTIDELEKLFKFDEMVLRHLVFREKEGIADESPIMKRKRQDDQRRGREAAEIVLPPSDGEADAAAELIDAADDAGGDTAADDAIGEGEDSSTVDLDAADKLNKVVDAAQAELPAEALADAESDAAVGDAAAAPTEAEADANAEADAKAAADDNAEATDDDAEAKAEADAKPEVAEAKAAAGDSAEADVKAEAEDKTQAGDDAEDKVAAENLAEANAEADAKADDNADDNQRSKQ